MLVEPFPQEVYLRLSLTRDISFTFEVYLFCRSLPTFVAPIQTCSSQPTLPAYSPWLYSSLLGMTILVTTYHLHYKMD